MSEAFGNIGGDSDGGEGDDDDDSDDGVNIGFLKRRDERLISACRSCNITRMERLLNAGANVNVISMIPETLLLIACEDYRDKIVTLLAGAGGKFLDYKEPLEYFVDYIDMLMKHHVRRVCSKYCSRNVAILLHAGVHINTIDKNEQDIPLWEACRKNTNDFVKLLLKVGASVTPMQNEEEEVELDEEGDIIFCHMPLWISQCSSAEDERNWIIKMRSSLNIIDSSYLVLISLLLAAGANPFMKIKEGKVAFDIYDSNLVKIARASYLYYRFKYGMLLSYQPEANHNIFSKLRNSNYDCWRYTLGYL